MVIYTYCVIDSKNTIDGMIDGLGGRPVYNIPYHDIGVAVSELKEKIHDIADADVLKDEEVIETLMTKFTVLPIRFLTLFNTKEELLSMIEVYYQDFRSNLARLRNKVEFGVKAIWPADTIKRRIIDAYEKNKHNVSISTESPAKTFIREKFEKHMIDKKFEEEAERCIRTVDGYFNKIATEKRLKRLQTENLLLNAAYLVENERQTDFKQAFQQLRSAPSDLKVLFSGPWPCYNFITLTKKPTLGNYLNREDMLSELIGRQNLSERGRECAYK